MRYRYNSLSFKRELMAAASLDTLYRDLSSLERSLQSGGGSPRDIQNLCGVLRNLAAHLEHTSPNLSEKASRSPQPDAGRTASAARGLSPQKRTQLDFSSCWPAPKAREEESPFISRRRSDVELRDLSQSMRTLSEATRVLEKLLNLAEDHPEILSESPKTESLCSRAKNEILSFFERIYNALPSKEQVLKAICAFLFICYAILWCVAPFAALLLTLVIAIPILIMFAASGK